MRKPWVYKRKNISTQLNSDVFTRVVAFDWHPMVEEEGQFKQVEGRKEASIYEVLSALLCHVERLADR